MTSRRQTTVRIPNPLGFHLRSAMSFAEIANRYECDVGVSAGGSPVNGKSPIDLLTLGAGQGTELAIVTEGRDAEAAIEALAECVASGFYKDE